MECTYFYRTDENRKCTGEYKFPRLLVVLYSVLLLPPTMHHWNLFGDGNAVLFNILVFFNDSTN